jgi:hypothetical protein
MVLNHIEVMLCQESSRHDLRIFLKIICAISRGIQSEDMHLGQPDAKSSRRRSISGCHRPIEVELRGTLMMEG